MPHRLHWLDKPPVTFTLRRATLQDELVFKSLVRFLRDLLRHQWRYESSDTADVLVVGYEPAVNGFDVSSEALKHRERIRIGASEPQPQRLVRPLRVSAVLLALNLAGDEVVRKRSVAKDAPSLIAPVISLLRWPSLATLRLDPRFIRITAVLAAKPTSLPDLIEKSGQPVDVCQRLIDALTVAGLVEVLATQTASAIPLTQSPRKLEPSLSGLRTGALAAAHEQAKNQSRERAEAGASLWGRIRRRLGIAAAPRIV